MAEKFDIDVVGEAGGSEIGAAVGPLTMAERRARKAELRTAKLEATRLKRELAATDARREEWALDEHSKSFNLKV